MTSDPGELRLEHLANNKVLTKTRSLSGPPMTVPCECSQAEPSLCQAMLGASYLSM